MAAVNTINGVADEANRIDPNRQQDFLSQAKDLGVPDSYVSSFLAANPGDYNRLASSYQSNDSASGNGGKAGPDTNAPSGGSGFNYIDPTTKSWTSMPVASAGPLTLPGMNQPTTGPRMPTFSPSSLTGVTGQPYPYSSQFSDPYTQQLEQTITGQLNGLTNPSANSPQSLLNSFLTNQFQRLSNSNGYTPDQQAVLRTQAIEPINIQRDTARQQVLQRASAQGLLPSSGIVQDELANVDKSFGAQQTAAQRDLAINQINMQAQQLQQALGLGNDLNQLDANTRNQVMQLAQMLYQLPINAMQNANAVINGTGSPVSLLGQLAQMGQYNQTYNGNVNANLWNSIGALIPGLLQ